jgi:hypothetical protein
MARLLMRFAVKCGEVRLGGRDRLQQFLGRDLADLPFVTAWLRRHAGDAVVLVAVVPGLDGAPGELPRLAAFVDEGHGGDGVDPFVPGATGHRLDGTEHPHLQIDRRLSHEGPPC